MSGYTLSIDYGTTYSVGVVASDAGTEVLELNRSRYFPSLVLLDPDGDLLVGNSAVNQAALYPDRVCATPKRLVGRPAILMGGQAVEVHRAVAAVLARLAEEAARRFGGAAPDRVILTHPALWAHERVNVLQQAARAAGLADAELVPEPVAAAAHYADGSLAEGATVAVYDLGGGTFDAAVLRRTAGGGFDVAGRPGGDPNLGGEDFDNELRELVEDHAARIDPERFEAARRADSARRQWSAFRREIREAKEALSDELKYPLAVPGIDDPVLVTRRELEALLEPHLSRTIEQLAATIADAGLKPKDLAAVYLTGGSSRIPLISTLLGQELGVRPQTWGDPKAVVALGAVHASRPAASRGRVGGDRGAEGGGAGPDRAVVTCPSCRTRNRVPADGRAARCARCRTPLPIPTSGTAWGPPDLGTLMEEHFWTADSKPGESADRPAAAPGAGAPPADPPRAVPARVVATSKDERRAMIALDADRETALARIAHVLEAMPVEHGPEYVTFKWAQAPRSNVRIGSRDATTPWLRQAQAQFASVREIGVELMSQSVGRSMRQLVQRPYPFGPDEWYLQISGLTRDAQDRETFEPFVHSLCAALSDGATSQPPDTATAGPAAAPDEPGSFPARVVLIDPKRRYAAIAVDADRDGASARIADLLEAVPVQLGPENVEFRHALAPNENLRLHFHQATTAWLSHARTQFETVRVLRVALVGPAIGVSLRHGRPPTYSPHEWYVQVFGLTDYGDDREAFEPFVHSFCAALSGQMSDPSSSGPVPHNVGSTSPPGPAAPQGVQPDGEVLVYQNRPWLQITNRRFTLKGLLGGIKLDVPVEEILTFKGDGISAVRVVLRDGRTERWNCGVQNKEKMLKALEQVTGRRRG